MSQDDVEVLRKQLLRHVESLMIRFEECNLHQELITVRNFVLDLQQRLDSSDDSMETLQAIGATFHKVSISADEGRSEISGEIMQLRSMLEAYKQVLLMRDLYSSSFDFLHTLVRHTLVKGLYVVYFGIDEWNGWPDKVDIDGRKCVRWE